jgi:hypothetical protein
MLMLGDVSAAESYFSSCDQSDTRAMMDRGLVAITQNAFQEALDIFSKALAKEPTSVLVRIHNFAKKNNLKFQYRLSTTWLSACCILAS